MAAIIFVHNGDSWYLWYTLRQARLMNPDAAIYLIGDRHLAHYDAFAQHVPINDHMAEAEAFAQVYRHLSTNSYTYELLCFQRWFVVNAFMRHAGLQSCVCLDSDVMVYTDLAAEQARFAQYDLTVIKGKNPQTMFISSQAALQRFCDFTYAFYAEHPEALEQRYIAYRALRSDGGICDMTAFDDYRRANPERVADLAEVRTKSVYDNNVRHADGFQMRHRYKRVRWVDGLPYAYPQNGGPLVRLHTLHFQGGSKLLIPYFASRRDQGFFRQLMFKTPLRRSSRGLLLLAGR